MLERIITAEAEDDDEDEVPDDESVNQMIARSNEEYEEFQVGYFLVLTSGFDSWSNL